MRNAKKVLAGALMGCLLAGPLTAAHAGWFDWLFKRKQKAELSAEYKGPQKLDSSSKWMCHLGGGCTGGAGLCCIDGMRSHFEGIKGIEKIEVDREKGVVLLTIKAGESVNVKDIQKELGNHWRLKTIEKQQSL